MLERLFELLFKYRPLVFSRGDLVFASPVPLGVVLALGAVALVLAAVAYRRANVALPARARLTLFAPRAGVVAVLVFCLSAPALRISTVVPQQNVLGILVDDSRSMGVADRGGETRGARAAAAFAPDGDLMRALSDRFRVRLFGFSSSLERTDSLTGLDFDGRRTDLAEALAAARRELSTQPLAGLVVVSDGADNVGGSLTESLLALAADRVPVHTVGIGNARFEPDIELRRAALPASVLQGAAVVAELSVQAPGFAGRTVPLIVEDQGRILSRAEIRLPASGEPAAVRAHFQVSEAGPRRVRFTIPPQDGELLAENNSVEALLDVERRVERILYFEGEPRFEVKFLRRAIADDDRLEVVTLLRTAEDKFLRLGVRDSLELVAGFPRTRAELFRYRGLILGSIEASFFTHDQLQMLAEFVSVRGGGLLVLGGRKAFAGGGWDQTPLADVLPVDIASAGPPDTTFFVEVTPAPSPLGLDHPVLQLRSTPAASGARWDSLPAVSLLHPLRDAKPGATVLLAGDGSGGPYVLLATQRFGRGRAVAFTAQDAWIWQMHADIPLEDDTHEVFWRQVLRYLVSEVPQPLTARLSTDRAEPGQTVTITADVADSGYVRVNGAGVWATVVDPAGAEHEVPLRWTVRRDGEYEAEWTPTMSGLHELRVRAEQNGRPLSESVTHLHAGDLGAEYFGAALQETTLRRIAEETGGQYYTPETLRMLPEDVAFTESGATVVEYRDLWDMPILLLLLVGLLSGEWALRKRRGLA